MKKNKLFILTRILFKSWGVLDISIGRRKNSRFLMLGILILCFMPLAISMGYLVSAVYDTLAEINQEGIILSIGLGVTAFIIFFFGIFIVMNTYYLAGDVERLLPLPLKPSWIIGSRFIVTVVYEYLTELLVLGPIILVYGVKSGAPVLYYIYSILVFLLLPVIPIIVSSLIVMVIMGFTSFGRNRDRLKLIGGISAIVLAIGGNMSLQNLMQKAADPDTLISMLQRGGNSLVTITSNIFPGIYFAAMGLVNSAALTGALNILIFALVAAAGIVLFLYTSELLYLRGVIGISEASARRKKVSEEEIEKVVAQNPSIKSYILKEIRLLFRTPIYFLNCVLINFIWPVILLLPMIMNTGQDGSFEALLQVVREGSNVQVYAAICGFIMFAASSNGIAASSISREGRNIFVTKYLPLSYTRQIMAKAFSGVLVSMISVVVMAAVAAAILQIEAGIVLMVLITGTVAVMFSSLAGVTIDLHNPKLNWDNEHKAVKQNLNVVLSMLIGAIFGGLTFFGTKWSGFDLVPYFLLVTAIYGLLCMGIYSFLNKNGTRLFEKIE